jgi:cobalamin biosynthesis Co2+ chelatase CbiK
VVPLKENGKERGEMKKKIVSLLMMVLVETTIATGCGATEATTEATTEVATETVDDAEADQKAADEVAALIDAIYVQERTDDTDMQCVEAKTAWDALTESQKELVYGVNATPEYFGRDTGDASKDDARNQDEIGENEILVVSFGTSYNDSRVADIKGIEDAIAEAYPDWSVRRAFTSQIIINHVQARDDEHIDNMEQALQRAVDNGVKNLVVQPTHLMQGTEYDELVNAVEKYSDKFETVVVSEPLLGEVGSDASVINEDKEKVAKAITSEAVSEAGYDSLESAKNDGVAFVFMGHGTSHTAKVSYSQMQTQMSELGYDNVFIGTVEGEPEETACENVIEAVAGAGYTKVVLRPLMVVAGDHANNDMAGDDEDSWKSMFLASGKFESVNTQISGLGSIDAIKQLYVEHTSAVMALEDTSSEATTETTTSTNNNTSKNLPDATYSADFETDSSMFHVNEAYDGKGTLYIQDGEMTIHISLTSKNIVNLYLGLAEDTQKSGAQLIEPTIDTVIYSDGTTEEVYGFDVPVPYLNEEFDLALIGTKGKWYDHKVKVSNPVISEGEYFIDVAFEGGSGKASISSPASINVSDGEVTALVEWSSPNYDYMIVDGEKYYPINEDGNSVFLIPVKAFDEPIEVIGDTVAMSTPHEIEYTLTFYFDTIKKPQ